MPIPDTYTRQLEDLILNKFLPVYEDWCRLNNQPLGISTEMLYKLKNKAKIAAILVKPKKPNA